MIRYAGTIILVIIAVFLLITWRQQRVDNYQQQVDWCGEHYGHEDCEWLWKGKP